MTSFVKENKQVGVDMIQTMPFELDSLQTTTRATFRNSLLDKGMKQKGKVKNHAIRINFQLKGKNEEFIL